MNITTAAGKAENKKPLPCMQRILFSSFSCWVNSTEGVRFLLYLDPSAKGLAEEIKRACRVAGVPVSVREADNDVKLGISRTQKALIFNILSISPKQENAIDEFGVYGYDPKSIEKGKEEPIKLDDHCMDAIRYMVMGMWTKIGAWLPVSEQEDEK